ncbi:radial spoke head protein, putative, partial [Ichthyophthirius multifiliis]
MESIIQKYVINNKYEEITDIPLVDEKEIQPDYYQDKAPTPEFKPKEKGKEVFTQIEDNELFDFILEVEPVLQVLVGKSVGQAIMELMEEFEMAESQKTKMMIQMRKNAELMVVQRMDAAYQRRQQEIYRRNKQHSINKEQNKLIHKRLLSRQIVKRTMFDSKQNCLNDLENLGFLKDLKENKFQVHFIPIIVENIIDCLKSNQEEKNYLDVFLNKIEKNAQDFHSKYIQIEKQRKQNILNQREENRI